MLKDSQGITIDIPPFSSQYEQWQHLFFCYFYRDAVECDIHFCGLLVMENKLKPETAPVISELLQADIRTVMITGTCIHIDTTIY